MNRMIPQMFLYGLACVLTVQSRENAIISLLPLFWKKKDAYEIIWLCVRVVFPDVVRQRLGKHVSAATNTQATIEELLDAAFSMRSVFYQTFNT
jgi:hypothetical protein